MSKNVSEVLGVSMAKVREMVDANTVIGEPIQAAEGVTLITIQGERVRVLPIDEPASSAAERVIEQLPGLVDKISELISAKKSEITEN